LAVVLIPGIAIVFVVSHLAPHGGIGIYAAQAIASALWLRRFRFGPLEWVWRSFSYGRRV